MLLKKLAEIEPMTDDRPTAADRADARSSAPSSPSRSCRPRLGGAGAAPAHEPIAIVGIGCRFPGGADDPDALWALLRDGVDAIGEVPADRWDIDALLRPGPDARRARCRPAAAGSCATSTGFDAAVLRHRAARGGGHGPAAAPAARGGVGGARARRAGAGGAGRHPHRRVRRHHHGRLRAAHAATARASTASAPTTRRASPTASRRAASPTCSACRARASRSTRPARRRSSPCTSPCRACAAGECDLALAGGVNLMLSPEMSHHAVEVPDDGARRPLQVRRRRAPTASCGPRAAPSSC